MDPEQMNLLNDILLNADKEQKIDYTILDKILSDIDNQNKEGVATTVLNSYENVKRTNDVSLDMYNYRYALFKRMLVELIPNKSDCVKLSMLGHEVLDEGGWVAYSNKKKEKEEKESRLREQEVAATVSAAESSKVSAESAKKANIISENSNRIAKWSLGVAIVAILFTIYQYLDSQSDKDKLELRIDSLVSDRVKSNLELNKIQMNNIRLKAAPTKVK